MKKYIAEFIGTFVLVTFGCGAAVTANDLINNYIVGQTISEDVTPLALSTLLIAFAFGLSIVAMAYSIGNVSGCHINPAVSIGVWAVGKLSNIDLLGYIIAQFLGATAGAGFLWAITGQHESLGQNGFGMNSALGTGYLRAIVVEIVLTAVFVLVILCVTSKAEYSKIAGMVIGLTLTLIHILGIPFTGTSVNPARSFGPAILVQGNALKQLPVFLIAPVLGAILAAIVFKLVFEEKEVAAENLAKIDNETENDEDVE